MKPFVSILIPHRNDSDKLVLCINALINQTYPNDKYEIIVIDNCSDELHREKVNNLHDNGNFTLLFEPKLSSYAARNLGLKHVKGEYIAFTDADCIPASDWIEKGVEFFSKSGKDEFIGGRIELFYKENNNPNTVELFEKIYSFRQHIFITDHSFAATANLLSPLYIIKNAGPFNENMKSNGDREWCLRAKQNGYKLTYREDVVVNHPARSNFRDFTRRQLRLCGGGFNIRKQSGKSSLYLFFINLFTAVPPIVTIFRVFKNNDFKKVNIIKKTKLVLLIIFIKYLRVYETFRLSLGFNPRNY